VIISEDSRLREAVADRMKVDGPRFLSRLKAVRGVKHVRAASRIGKKAFLEGVMFWAKETGVSKDIQAVRTTNGILLFFLPLDAALAAVESVSVPGRKASPDKVLAKMLLHRLLKLDEIVVQTNRRKAGLESTKASVLRKPTRRAALIPRIGESGIVDLAGLLGYLGRSRIAASDLADQRGEVESFLKRPEVTEAVVAHALGMLTAKEVMES
jgi:hypothetical protein